MKLPLINQNDVAYANEILNTIYKQDLIPAEKKTYLTKLKDSVGPYMAIESREGTAHYLLDAASQIATLGHGFNSSVLFGSSQFLESWTNETKTKEMKKFRESYVNFFSRKLNWKKTHMTIVHSGAEANETALGYAYLKRAHKDANKVMAFEGSFHGRMMVTLSATWNKSKREPFEWKNYLTDYVKYPEIDDAEINVFIPDNWRKIWNEATLKDFSIPEEWLVDPYQKREVEALLEIRERLKTKKIFAILVEPMQCEGGDRYSSDRFHTALLLMARSFKVSVIFDEVQTGFHLGKEFFWHRQLNLKDINGQQLNSDYVVCAKKAQVGIILSHWPTKSIFKGEEFSVASALRGYAHAVSLDQCQERILKLHDATVSRLHALIKDHSDVLSRPRVNGLAFAFDLPTSELMNKFVEYRFKHGLMFYPAGDRTLRFRLNTAFKASDLDFLFMQLDNITNELFNKKAITPVEFVEVDHSPSQELYEWHELLTSTKLDQAKNKKINKEAIFEKISNLIQYKTKDQKLNLVQISNDNYKNYRSQIEKIQMDVYEPARQTDIELFDITVQTENSVCLGLTDEKGKLQGIAFAGPLHLYPLERGLRQDPNFNNPYCLYMLDVTVRPEIQTSGLGKSLKYALYTFALTKNVKRIQGRNRDRLASAMLSINLSLGAIEQNYISEDYPDFESFRDVFYYTTKLQWKETQISLSNAITTPFGLNSLTKEHIAKLYPTLVNKVCLSNFVSKNFLESVDYISKVLPESLRHMFTASGQSEACDKVCKTIWVNLSEEKRTNQANRMITFKGHYFGQGSMLSRSLSLDNDPYFDVVKFDHPSVDTISPILDSVKKELETGKIMAIWLEPLLQRSMRETPYEFLRQLKLLAQKYNTPVIYNETASQFYRYTSKAFMCSNIEEIAPNAGMMYLSGQAAIAFCSKNYYLSKPLMMISTWDGDEFHFLSYQHALKNILDNKAEYQKTREAFSQKLIDELSRHDIDSIKIENGRGFFKGHIPSSFAKLFSTQEDYSIVCPSFDSMKEFLNGKH